MFLVPSCIPEYIEGQGGRAEVSRSAADQLGDTEEDNVLCLSLGYFICNMGMIIISVSKDYWNDDNNICLKRLLEGLIKLLCESIH